MKDISDDVAGNGEVTVRVVKVQAAPRWLTRLNCEQQTGLPPEKFYDACARWGVEVAPVGQLRVVDADAFSAAQKAHAKPVRRKKKEIDMGDADALARAGLRLVSKGGVK